jgi:hypothetical protein
MDMEVKMHTEIKIFCLAHPGRSTKQKDYATMLSQFN